MFKMQPNNVTLYILIYITLYFQYINSLNITINSENNNYVSKGSYRLKTELEHMYVTNYEKDYYCKNNNCIEVESFTKVKFMEFPENNKTKRYILNSCIYDDKNNKIINCENYKEFYDGDIIDLSCKNDSECFYNKCIDNYCVFNEDPSSTHCVYVHKGFAMFQHTFLHCGKTYTDVCKFNYECSSYKCYEGKCGYHYYKVSDSNSTKKTLETLLFFIIIIALIFICLFYCAFKAEHEDKLKRKQQSTNSENDTKKLNEDYKNIKN